MKVDGSSLLIRADANTRIGTGHLMRCLALAQAWKDSGGEAIFITACESAGLLQRLSNEGFEVIQMAKSYPDPTDWEATSQVLAEHPDAWVVLDGYHFDEAYQKQVKETGHRLLVIDDMAQLEHYYADIVLNQNLHAEQLDYSCEPYTQLLLGIQYVLLRREFLKWRDWKREIPDVARKMLITLGGGDPDKETLKAIRAMDELKPIDLEAKVIVGPSNPHIAALKEAIHRSPFTIHLLQAARNMPELMAWADIAVSAAGSTCWELAFMGLPSVTVVLADNQRGIGEGLSDAGAVLNLGRVEQEQVERIADAVFGLLAAPDKRVLMSKAGRQLIDGLGSERVLKMLRAAIS